MKKAFQYLEANGIDYTFYDYKKQSPQIKDLERWHKGFGELPVNKRGTTFRKLKEQYEGSSQAQQTKLLQENPSAIKRPILEGEGVLLRGFEPEMWPDS